MAARQSARVVLLACKPFAASSASIAAASAASGLASSSSRIFVATMRPKRSFEARAARARPTLCLFRHGDVETVQRHRNHAIKAHEVDQLGRGLLAEGGGGFLVAKFRQNAAPV